MAELFAAYGLGLMLSAVVAWVFTRVVRQQALTRGWTDDPDEERRVPRPSDSPAGGIAIMAAVGAGLLYFWVFDAWLASVTGVSFELPPTVLLIGASTMGVAGLYDDLNFMSFDQQFVIQVVVACIVINAGYVIETVPNPLGGPALELGWGGVPLTLVWIIGIVNAVNLLDGLDGLAAGTSLITFGSLAAAFSVTGVSSYLPLVLVVSGALAGFLVYNFHPATIFMEDCGSVFVGFLLATYSLQGPHETSSLLAFLIPILAMGLPVLDTGLSLVRRFLAEKPLFRPDRDHIHHRIARRFGLIHRMTVLVLYGMSLLFGLLAFAVAVASNLQRTLILLGGAALIYTFLRALGYFRLRDLPWLIREREEFGRIRRFVEAGEVLGREEELPLNGDEEEPWVDFEEELSADAG